MTRKEGLPKMCFRAGMHTVKRSGGQEICLSWRKGEHGTAEEIPCPCRSVFPGWRVHLERGNMVCMGLFISSFNYLHRHFKLQRSALVQRAHFPTLISGAFLQGLCAKISMSKLPLTFDNLSLHPSVLPPVSLSLRCSVIRKSMYDLVQVDLRRLATIRELSGERRKALVLRVDCHRMAQSRC